MKYIITFLFTVIMAMPLLGENIPTVESEHNTVVDLSRKYQKVKTGISILKERSEILEKNLKKNSQEIDTLHEQMDDICNHMTQVERSLAQIDDLGKKQETEQDKLNERYGLLLFIVSVISIALLLSVLILIKYIRKANHKFETELEEYHKNGNATNDRLNELMLNKDSTLIDLLKGLSEEKGSSTSLNQSFILEIAEQITRMEVNLYRMDSSVKGHKQLTRAINNIKDSLKEKGYEVSELLGTKYVEGMKVNADFVEDEKLPLGTQIITGVRKPQILFNGKLLQAAEITVSQNI